MVQPIKDPPNVNDNAPVERKLKIILKWAKQMRYGVVADAIEHALVELEARRK
jgi:hypothetical protein